MLAPPPEGAVEVGPCPVDLAQLVASHGQEEQVEGVGLALAGGEAFFQGGDRLRKLVRTVLGNAQRVEVDGCAGRSATAFRARTSACSGSRRAAGPVASRQARLL